MTGGAHDWIRNKKKDVEDFSEAWSCRKCLHHRMVDPGGRPDPRDPLLYDLSGKRTEKTCDDRLVEIMMSE